MADRTAGGRTGIWTPSNIITIIRILLVPVFVTALLAPWPDWFGLDGYIDGNIKRFCAAAIFVFISATDWLDGYLARSRNEVTDFGKFIDPLADKILVAGALIALVELDALPTWVVLIILAREFIVSGVRMMAASKGVVIAASNLGKVKTVLQMIAIVLFVLKDSHMSGPFQNAASDWFWLISWLFMIAALVLTLVSLADYLVKARYLFGFHDDDFSSSAMVGASEATLQSRAQEVIDRALADGRTVATAESLTGGLIGASLTAIAGSSGAFLGGIVSYAASVKHDVLGVDESIILEDGVVSSRCAESMAQGARRLTGADAAIAVTGIAGPGGAEPGKPIGTVWIALATEDANVSSLHRFSGSRQEIREATALEALRVLADWLQGEER